VQELILIVPQAIDGNSQGRPPESEKQSKEILFNLKIYTD
jgi:hypothetical protein